jgi:hypothetical protein
VVRACIYLNSGLRRRLRRRPPVVVAVVEVGAQNNAERHLATGLPRLIDVTTLCECSPKGQNGSLLRIGLYGVLWMLVAALQVVALAGPRAASGQQQPQVPAPAADEQAREQARKLKLEIAKLKVETSKVRKERDLEGTVQRLAPGATAILAFIAATLGLLRYFRDTRASRHLRLEEGMEANLQRLADYGTTGVGWSARAVVALENLEALCRQTDEPERSRDRVTDTIKHAVRDDLDLGRLEQAGFDGLCVTHWAPYRDFLSSNASWQGGLLDRYRRALKELRRDNPEVAQYLVGAVWSDRRFKSPVTLKETLYRHVQRLVGGYRQHVALLDASDPNLEGRVMRAETMLADGLGNADLAKELLAEDKGER